MLKPVLLLWSTCFVLASSREIPAQNVFAVANVNVIDGTCTAPRAGQTVVVRNGRIDAVLDVAQTPSGVQRVDGTGKFLIPGLWDSHAHLTRPGAYTLPVYVANGVTTIRDMGGNLDSIVVWRQRIAAGSLVGPRLLSAGPILETPERLARIQQLYPSDRSARTRVSVPGPAPSRATVDSLARLGVHLVKYRTVVSRETYFAIAAAARANRLPLAGHGDIAPEDMIAAAQATIEHPISPSLQARSSSDRATILRSLSAGRVALVPTLVNYYESSLIDPKSVERIIDDSLAFLDARRRFVSPALLQFWREQLVQDLGGPMAPLRQYLLRRRLADIERDLREMHNAGVRLLPGTDLSVALMYPGYSLHDELRYLVEVVRMTPLEAICRATRDAADVMRMGDSLGTIVATKLADMVLLDADPTIDIRNVARIRAVIWRGNYLDRAALDAQLSDAAANIRGLYKR